jgi:hypothetical protein
MIIDIQRYWGDVEIFHVGELCARIIEGMKQDGTVTLCTKEHRSCVSNGGYRLLDELSSYYKWDKSKIILETPSNTEHHSEYTVIRIPDYNAGTFKIPSTTPDWNKEKFYGLFIGRASAPRIRAIQNHLNFKYRDMGIASFHDNLMTYNNRFELTNYFVQTNQRWSDIKDIRPFSDIDATHSVPITPGINDQLAIWDSAYQKIALEIICETSTRPDCFTRSEKLLRCITYKRPFLLVGARNTVHDFKIQESYDGKKFNLKSFSNIIDESYDEYDGTDRVDMIFKELDRLISSGKIYTLIDDCKEILEHNYHLVKDHINSSKKLATTDTWYNYFDKNNWHRP